MAGRDEEETVVEDLCGGGGGGGMRGYGGWGPIDLMRFLVVWYLVSYCGSAYRSQTARKMSKALSGILKNPLGIDGDSAIFSLSI